MCFIQCLGIYSRRPLLKSCNDVFKSVGALLLILYDRYNRNWRYHKDMRLWLTKDPSNEIVTKNATFERGTYVFFDIVHWERVRKECVIWYEQIEERVPSAPVTALSSMAGLSQRTNMSAVTPNPLSQGIFGAIGPVTNMRLSESQPEQLQTAPLSQATSASIASYFQGQPRAQGTYVSSQQSQGFSLPLSSSQGTRSSHFPSVSSSSSSIPASSGTISSRP
jgi:hypothetical protein